MKIVRNGSQPSLPGPAETFTGTVRRDRMFASEAPGNLQTGTVTFEPCARTAWHTHPLGQILIVTCGCGWVQSWGQPREVVQPGDIIWTPPGEKHWHGATSTTAMSRIAITDAVGGKAVDWMEHVSDEQYLAGLANQVSEVVMPPSS